MCVGEEEEGRKGGAGISRTDPKVWPAEPLAHEPDEEHGERTLDEAEQRSRGGMGWGEEEGEGGRRANRVMLERELGQNKSRHPEPLDLHGDSAIFVSCCLSFSHLVPTPLPQPPLLPHYISTPLSYHA